MSKIHELEDVFDITRLIHFYLKIIVSSINKI